MKPIIEVNHLSKKYRYGESQPYYTLRDILVDVVKKPFKIFHKNQEGGNLRKDEFWALKNVSFSVNQGDTVGVIGPNGSGKSTLLKILSRITPPTSGEATLRGRVGSLLEVGTGFQQELTGRENIYLNGAILGMSRREINKKFDEIVDFSGVEKFLDTPVKHYSSGMYMRLAFAVAAHLDSDILIIDEVLAVGDSEFQKKCLGKMDEITKKEGRTIIFVSHDTRAIEQLCSKCILLEKGNVVMFDDTEKVINHYLNNSDLSAVNTYQFYQNKAAQVTKVSIRDENKKHETRIPVNEEFFVDIEYEVSKFVKKAILSVMFYSGGEILLLSSESDKNSQLKDYDIGKYKTTVLIPAFLFNVGMYYFDIRFHKPDVELIDHKQHINFEIIDTQNNPKSIIFNSHNMGKIASILDYQTTKTN